MQQPKTTIFGTLAAIAGTLAGSLTGTAQLVAQLVSVISGTLFAYHAQDKKNLN